MKEQTEHIQWIDSWRGMLILLVVFWHALGACLEVSSADVHSSQWLHGFISNFHMVAFFAISGFVWNPGRESLWRYAKKNFGRLMVPYYCFAGLGLLVLSVMVLAGMGGGYETIFSSAKEILFAGRPSCYSPVWFLSSLFAILMVCWALAPVLRNMAVLGGGVVLLSYFEKYCFGRYCSMGFFNLHVLPRYLVAFMIGHLLSRFCKRDFCLSLLQKVVLLILGVIGLIAFAQTNFVSVPKALAFFMPLKGMFVIVSTMMVAIALDNKWLAWIGQGCITLGILCLHKYPIVLAQKLPCSRGVVSDDAMMIAGALAVTVVSVAFAVGGTMLIRRIAPWALGRSVR